MPDLANPQVGDIFELPLSVSFKVLRTSPSFMSVQLLHPVNALDTCEAIHKAGMELAIFVTDRSSHNMIIKR